MAKQWMAVKTLQKRVLVCSVTEVSGNSVSPLSCSTWPSNTKKTMLEPRATPKLAVLAKHGFRDRRIKGTLLPKLGKPTPFTQTHCPWHAAPSHWIWRQIYWVGRLVQAKGADLTQLHTRQPLLTWFYCPREDHASGVKAWPPSAAIAMAQHPLVDTTFFSDMYDSTLE